MNARIAGSVTNSLFSASVDGDPSQAHSDRTARSVPQSGDLVLPRGVINAKVEGTINNSNNTARDRPVQGLLRRLVHLSHGPVIPPIVALCPVQSPTVYHKGQTP